MISTSVHLAVSMGGCLENLGAGALRKAWAEGASLWRFRSRPVHPLCQLDKKKETARNGNNNTQSRAGFGGTWPIQPAHRDSCMISCFASTPLKFWINFFCPCPWHAKTPHRGSNLHHSNVLSHSSDNARALSRWATRELSETLNNIKWGELHLAHNLHNQSFLQGCSED